MLLLQRIFLTSLLGPTYSNLQPKPRPGGIIKDAGKACTIPTITILGRVVQLLALHFRPTPYPGSQGCFVLHWRMLLIGLLRKAIAIAVGATLYNKTYVFPCFS